MGSIHSVDASFAGRAVDQLRGWPALTLCRTESGAGKELAPSTRPVVQLHGENIVRLHGENEAGLYLTAPVISRMRKVLLNSGRVTVEPGGDWIRVRLDSDNDVGLLISLVSVAIKANITAAGRPQGKATYRRSG